MVPFSAATGFSNDFGFRLGPILAASRLPLERVGAEREESPASAVSGFASGGAGGLSTASPTGGRSSARMNA